MSKLQPSSIENLQGELATCNNVDDVDYVIDLIYKEDRVDIYAHDIETILTLNISNDTMASGVGLNPQIIYKIKGLFR